MRSRVTVPNMAPRPAVAGCPAATRTQLSGSLSSTAAYSTAAPLSWVILILSIFSVADRVMQEVYSFTLKERITLLRKAKEGDVEAMQREPFTALADKGGLTKAFEEHKKRGGKLTDEEVFHGVLPKTKSLSLPKP